MATPILLYGWWNWAGSRFPQFKDQPNPFARFFFLQHYAPTSKNGDPRYTKGYEDAFLVAYMIVFLSFTRQVISVNIAYPLATYLGIRKTAQKARFGEQLYGFVYWGTVSLWAIVSRRTSAPRNEYLINPLQSIIQPFPSYYFKLGEFWARYPQDMTPSNKRFVLTQSAYWMQQFFVMVLGLEKPRKDFKILVLHHLMSMSAGL
jgi:acyl-CoA-dependent ceramide synthase